MQEQTEKYSRFIKNISRFFPPSGERRYEAARAKREVLHGGSSNSREWAVSEQIASTIMCSICSQAPHPLLKDISKTHYPMVCMLSIQWVVSSISSPICAHFNLAVVWCSRRPASPALPYVPVFNDSSLCNWTATQFTADTCHTVPWQVCQLGQITQSGHGQRLRICSYNAGEERKEGVRLSLTEPNPSPQCFSVAYCVWQRQVGMIGTKHHSC